ncbi:MAG: hypothetical protein ABID54_00430 [Pseudomonadota bacterium]
MNRILFLPASRHLRFYAKRAFLRGHWSIFKLVDLKDGWQMLDFEDLVKMEKEYWPRFYGHYGKWVRYFREKKRIDFLVIERESNIEINAAVLAAQKFGIPVSYVMHGCDIFHHSDRKGLVDDYEYLYIPNEFNRRYFREFGGRAEIRKFNRHLPKKTTFSPGQRIKKLLYIPMFNHPSDRVHVSGCLLSNEERHVYNLAFWETFVSSGCRVTWCHDPRLDREKPNLMVRHFESETSDMKRMRWVKRSKQKYFREADAIVVDVGSTAFFEAIGAGKPVLCLYHEKSIPLKVGVKDLFGNCLQSFSTVEEGVLKLKCFLQSGRLFEDYTPHDFLAQELENPNESLIWEEKR